MGELQAETEVLAESEVTQEQAPGVEQEVAVEPAAEVAPEPKEATDETTKEEPDEAPGKESVRESVKRAYARLQKNGDTGKETEKAKQEAGKQEPKSEELAKEFEIDPELLPPERLNAAERQLFSNLPKGMKRGVARMFKNHEGMATRAQQEYSAATREARGVIEAVQPYLNKWGQSGWTAPAAIAQLASAHERLVNPQTSFQTFIELGKDIGIDFEQLARVARGEASAPTQQQYAPPTQAAIPEDLRNKVDRLYSSYEQQEYQREVLPILSQFEAVQNEIDPATGDYLHPELHDDNYLERLKPLVSSLLGTVPGITPGDALKKALYMSKGRDYQPSNSLQPTARIPAANNTPQRASPAAVTVRGKTAPITAGQGSTVEPPSEALRSARETARWVYNNLSNGTL